MNYKPLEAYLDLPWTYHLEWWADQGGYYVATVEELPGCLSDGKTVEMALIQVKEALQGYIMSLMEANELIPEPVTPDQFKGQIAYRTTPDKHYKLAKLSQRKKVSINKLIDAAVDNTLALTGKARN